MIRNGQTLRSIAEALGISDNRELSVRRYDNGCQRTEDLDLLNSLADDCRTPSIIRLELKHGQYEQIDHIHRKFDPPVTQRDEVSEQRSPVTKT